MQPCSVIVIDLLSHQGTPSRELFTFSSWCLSSGFVNDPKNLYVFADMSPLTLVTPASSSSHDTSSDLSSGATAPKTQSIMSTLMGPALYRRRFKGYPNIRHLLLPDMQVSSSGGIAWENPATSLAPLLEHVLPGGEGFESDTCDVRQSESTGELLKALETWVSEKVAPKLAKAQTNAIVVFSTHGGFADVTNAAPSCRGDVALQAVEGKGDQLKGVQTVFTVADISRAALLPLASATSESGGSLLWIHNTCSGNAIVDRLWSTLVHAQEERKRTDPGSKPLKVTLIAEKPLLSMLMDATVCISGTGDGTLRQDLLIPITELKETASTGIQMAMLAAAAPVMNLDTSESESAITEEVSAKDIPLMKSSSWSHSKQQSSSQSKNVTGKLKRMSSLDSRVNDADVARTWHGGDADFAAVDTPMPPEPPRPVRTQPSAMCSRCPSGNSNSSSSTGSDVDGATQEDTPEDAIRKFLQGILQALLTQESTDVAEAVIRERKWAYNSSTRFDENRLPVNGKGYGAHISYDHGYYKHVISPRFDAEYNDIRASKNCRFSKAYEEAELRAVSAAMATLRDKSQRTEDSGAGAASTSTENPRHGSRSRAKPKTDALLVRRAICQGLAAAADSLRASAKREAEADIASCPEILTHLVPGILDEAKKGWHTSAAKYEEPAGRAHHVSLQLSDGVTALRRALERTVRLRSEEPIASADADTTQEGFVDIPEEGRGADPDAATNPKFSTITAQLWNACALALLTDTSSTTALVARSRCRQDYQIWRAAARLHIEHAWASGCLPSLEIPKRRDLDLDLEEATAGGAGATSTPDASNTTAGGAPNENDVNANRQHVRSAPPRLHHWETSLPLRVGAGPRPLERIYDRGHAFAEMTSVPREYAAAIASTAAETALITAPAALLMLIDFIKFVQVGDETTQPQARSAWEELDSLASILQKILADRIALGDYSSGLNYLSIVRSLQSVGGGPPTSTTVGELSAAQHRRSVERVLGLKSESILRDSMIKAMYSSEHRGPVWSIGMKQDEKVLW